MVVKNIKTALFSMDRELYCLVNDSIDNITYLNIYILFSSAYDLAQDIDTLNISEINFATSNK